jgi:hypothetical protein
VLVVGGYSGDNGTLASTELYDPGSGTWTAAGNMKEGRAGHTATLLPDGRVLYGRRRLERKPTGVRGAVRPGQRKLKITRPICGTISGSQGSVRSLAARSVDPRRASPGNE